MQEAYELADRGDAEGYNSVKVMCNDVQNLLRREWVGLTDEEKAQFVVTYYPSNWDRKTAVALMSDYEKYLKEKNHVVSGA